MAFQPAPGFTDYALMLLLALVFGSSFMFTNIGVSEIPPLTVAAGRVSVAALVFLILRFLSGQHLKTDRTGWLAVVGCGLFGNAIPFTLITWGQLRVEAGLTAILMAIIPLATLVMAHFLTVDEKMGIRKFFGVLLGLAGVVVLMGWESLTTVGANVLQQIAIVVATVCYALNAILTKQLVKLPRLAVSAWMMVVASLALVPLSMIVDQPWHLSPNSSAIISVIILGLGPTAFALWMIILIIDRQGASFLAQINFFVPVFGVLLAATFLNEVLPTSGYIALAFILAGIALSRNRGALIAKQLNK